MLWVISWPVYGGPDTTLQRCPKLREVRHCCSSASIIERWFDVRIRGAGIPDVFSVDSAEFLTLDGPNRGGKSTISDIHRDAQYKVLSEKSCDIRNIHESQTDNVCDVENMQDEVWRARERRQS